MNTPAFTVKSVNWFTDRLSLSAVRGAVFIEEQKVPPTLEWDDADEHAHHVLATAADGTPVGTGRLKPDCQIGRMAVLEAWRRRGVGGTILMSLIELAQKHGCSVVRLHAQTHAIDFYCRYGFAPTGDEFEEAGIAHRAMVLRLRREGG